MLVIRMQRIGRKGHAQFRVVVQDSRWTPTSGKVVARIGSYDPHTKTVTLNKERAEHYLVHGAQPTPRVVRLLKAEKVKLPDWVEQPAKVEGKVRNPDKRRSTRPAEAEVAEEPAVEEATAEETAVTEDQPAETPAEPEAKATTDEASEAPAAEASEPTAEPEADSDKS